MELYELNGELEEYLAKKADAMRAPLGGSMELTPLCNMNCKMCYIRQDPQEMKKQGRMLSCDEWLEIARDARDNGVLFLLLTGGEPLVYPEFKRLYTSLLDMGFILTINTNGTLIDESWADLFANRPCRRLNITYYGKDDETYAKLCQHPKGHTRLMRALDLLDERKIMYRLNFTVSIDNADCLEYACEEAKRRKVPIETAKYLFPPIKRDDSQFERLSPEQAAGMKLNEVAYTHGTLYRSIAARNTLQRLNTIEFNRPEGLLCRAGRSGFWMSWNGDLLPCGQFVEPKMSLLDHSFGEAWQYIVEQTAKLRIYSGCASCGLRHICQVCGAVCLCESGGNMTAKPDYMCRMTEEYRLLLQKYADQFEELKERENWHE